MRNLKELRELRRERKSKAMQVWGCRCVACEVALKCDGFAQFHHTDTSKKYKSLCELWTRKDVSIVDEELKKCILLCHDCHSELHKTYGKKVTGIDTSQFLFKKWFEIM